MHMAFNLHFLGPSCSLTCSMHDASEKRRTKLQVDVPHVSVATDDLGIQGIVLNTPKYGLGLQDE